MCNDVVQDGTIATCSCICEAGSLYPACIGRSEGTVAATPGQCPDMLQGRRVLSRGDALAIAAPRFSGSSNMIALGSIYRAENDPDNAGIGLINGEAALTQNPNIGCRMQGGPPIPFPDQVRFARLFDLPYAMMVHLRLNDDRSQVNEYYCTAATPTAKNMLLVISSSQSGAPSVPTYAWTADAQWVQLAAGDFNYDGYDDLVFLNRYFLQVFTAVDPDDPGKGIKQVANVDTRLLFNDLRAPINTPVTGDFNGDGIMDVAWIGGNFPYQNGSLSVFFASICPGSVSGTICEGKQPFQVILDPASVLFPNVSGATSTIALDNATLASTSCGVVQTARTVNTATGSLRAGAIAVGNFENNGSNPRGAPIDELVVAYVSGTRPNYNDANACKLNIQYWTYTPLDSPTSSTVWAKQRGDTLVTPLVYDKKQLLSSPTYSLYARAAYLDWYGTVQQAVIGLSGLYPGLVTFWYPITVSVSGSGDAAFATECDGKSTQDGTGDYAWGLAVGRFSTSTTINPDNSKACGDFASASPGDCPYNPQIAMLLAKDNQNGGGTGDPSIDLYSVVASDPFGSDNSRKCANDASVRGYLPLKGRVNNLTSGYHSVPPLTLRGGSLVSAGDAFGNSVRLGPPTVVRVSEHSEPQLVIQAPPSLIDYVQPDEQDFPAPAIVNFTRAPNNYQAQIQFDTGSQDTASTRETGSFSSSITSTVGGQLKFPTAYLGTVDIKNQQSWTQFNQETTSQQLGTYATTRLQTGGAIGADDQVWWTQTTFNVFTFPQLGVDNCPASITCGPSTPGCTGPASGAVLTCEPSGSGCHCLSAGAVDSMCPAQPAEAADVECTTQGGVACCSLLPQPLNVSFSGPQEVARASSPGATIEWYQPRHEPGQILSYPANTLLLRQRNPGSEALASLTSFTTGTNNTSESMSWSCGTSSDVSSGTTSRHSFESDTSITIGMNNLQVKPLGANVSYGFNYQQSNSFSTLNSYTVGLTASSSVGLLLEGSGFINSDQYAYGVSGLVLGATKPTSVLDNPNLTVCPVANPNCSAAQEVQADCTTTGPLTVAFAANPTVTGRGVWWQATSPYLHDIDVGLNNPTRWRRVPASEVSNTYLQCRGPANAPVCYTRNQPPTQTGAADVWSSLFYHMKGLFVTEGGATGPMRDSAAVGDSIFLKARVYNYSLKSMASGSRVYARFYRQQLDVNQSNGAVSVLEYAKDADGNPRPAVPIGPAGLGDLTPVPVVSPLDGSATIPPFNTSTDPSRDNISLATTSYIATDDDACEYDSGMQSCDGAYYAYWMTVWAEDVDGKLISELAGHGLGASFDPTASYHFITDVPLEPVSFAGRTDYFTNNVGMFKMMFSIVPADSNGRLASNAPRPGPLSLDRMSLSSGEAVLLGQPVVVSAQVVESGASAPGATVAFSDGDPQDGGNVFDAEWLPVVRAHDREYVSVNYIPESCGPHQIYAQVTGGSNVLPAELVALLDVGIDYTSAIGFLVEEVRGVDLDFPGNASSAHKNNLVLQLDQAEQALDENRTEKAIRALETFSDALTRLERQGRIDKETADALIGQVQQIIGCV